MSSRIEALEQKTSKMAGSHRLRPTRNGNGGLESPQSGTIHERLDDPSGQIRLLLATESTQNDILNFEISTHSLANVPAYHAISYTWGQDDTQRSVYINGTEFCVNQNCYYALWQACLHYSETPVWIDSLCIDQGNSTEKNAQVWIMPDIYQGAARVLACVGPHADNSMALAPAVPELERLQKLQITLHRETTYNAEDEVNQFARLVRESIGLEALLHLFWAFRGFKRRPYWKRLWIQQEVGLARKVHILCGDDLLFWRCIQLFLELYNEIYDDIIDHPEWLSEADCSRVYDERPSAHYSFNNLMFLLQDGDFELGRLLRFSESLDCEDFHDRVYGVLGFAKPWVRQHLLPDYSLTATQLALQVAGVLSFHHVDAVLASLKIDYVDVELRPLVKRGHSSNVVVDHVAPNTGGRCSCYLVREDRERRLTAPGATLPTIVQFDRYCYQYTIRTDDNVQLTTDVASSLNRPSSFIDSNDLSAQATLFNAKSIVVNGERAGFVCHAARDGDIIVELTAAMGGWFLVLRHSGAELYDLVGRGFLLPDCYLTDLETASGDSHGSHVRKEFVAVRVSISPEESIAFWAMQLQERKRQEPRRTMDMIARLNASITTHPHGAVQITDHESLEARRREGGID